MRHNTGLEEQILSCTRSSRGEDLSQLSPLSLVTVYVHRDFRAVK